MSISTRTLPTNWFGVLLVLCFGLSSEAGAKSRARLICRPPRGGFSSATLSPDGKRIAYSEPDMLGSKYRPGVWVVNSTKGRPKLLYGQPLYRLRWSPDTKLLAGTHSYERWEGTEKTGLTRRRGSEVVVFDASTGRRVAWADGGCVLLLPSTTPAGGKGRAQSKQVSVRGGDLGNLEVCGWFPDGHRVLLEQGFPARSYLLGFAEKRGLLRVLDIKTGRCEALGQSGVKRFIGMFDLCPKTGAIAGTMEDGNLGAYDLSTSKLKPLTHVQRQPKRNQSGRFLLPFNLHAKWSPDGTRLLYWREGELNRWQLWMVSRDGREHSSLGEFPRQEEQDTFWSPDGRAVAWIGLSSDPRRANDPLPFKPSVTRLAQVGGGFGPGPFCIYTIRVADPKLRCVLTFGFPYRLTGWSQVNRLVCNASEAMFEIRL